MIGNVPKKLIYQYFSAYAMRIKTLGASLNSIILRQSRVQLSVVVAAAFLMRFLLALSPAVDIDEATAYAPAALFYLKGNWTFNTSHPMLIKLLFAGSVLLFGEDGRIATVMPWLPESIGAIRLVSVTMGAATCLIVYWLVREVTGSHLLAIVAAILLAFDPISMAESSYGLLDPGMTFFYMLSILFFYRYVKSAKMLDFFASAITFGLAVASKYFAFIAFFIFVGALIGRKKIRTEWKCMPVFLGLSIIVFFAVQPYLWTSPLVHVSRSLAGNQYLLRRPGPIKPPGNPFLIPQTKFMGIPWPYIGSSPVAAKPDFPVNLSDAAPSPWWYLLYIQTMYSTPFELVVYPLAIAHIITDTVRRRPNDLTTLSGLLISLPALLFAILSVRLPQYAILPSTSATMLGPVALADLSGKWKRIFLLSLIVSHVGWTLCALLTSGSHFTGWGFDVTFLTPILANIFGLIWKLTQGIHW